MTVGINNPFKNKDGLGSRISDTGFLSHFRWYDPLLLAGTGGVIGAQVIGAREAAEGYMKTDPVNIDTPKPPPMAPDLTDAAIYEAGKAHAFAMGVGKNRRSTFLTGQSATSTVTPRKTLLGG